MEYRSASPADQPRCSLSVTDVLSPPNPVLHRTPPSRRRLNATSLGRQDECREPGACFRRMAEQVPLPPPGFDELTVDEKLEYLDALWDRIAAHPNEVPVPEWLARRDFGRHHGSAGLPRAARSVGACAEAPPVEVLRNAGAERARSIADRAGGGSGEERGWAWRGSRVGVRSDTGCVHDITQRTFDLGRAHAPGVQD